MKEQIQRLEEREHAAEEYYASSNGTPFPPPPGGFVQSADAQHWENVMLAGWVEEKSVFDIH